MEGCPECHFWVFEASVRIASKYLKPRWQSGSKMSSTRYASFPLALDFFGVIFCNLERLFQMLEFLLAL